ncbi:uncharacterized protein LOC131213404 [Anopheles bellator]|uniref:uncharacterized protein LOC131213404 n=1 Tax=Anopheles bellator TaxID=139047 RepID=UPI00264942CA|nr:uncharacterized protein LOC131213404 [Anopheles bellator]
MTEMSVGDVVGAKLIECQRENEVPVVSMDGEAHPNMTLAAIGLGVLVALIILITLIAFITRWERSPRTKVPSLPAAPIQPIETVSQKVSASGRSVTFSGDCELHDVITRM